MKKSENTAHLVGMIILGIAIGIGICFGISKIPSKPLTDADVAKELIQSFKEVEAICGKHNVQEICIGYTSGCGDQPDGFTCGNWKQALHPEDYDENGYLIREEVMDDWR